MASSVLIYNKILSFCCFVGKRSSEPARKCRVGGMAWLLQSEDLPLNLETAMPSHGGFKNVARFPVDQM